MADDEAIRRITKLLEQGCTMLAVHHDCGAPLFRCKGEVICPVCSFEEAETSSSALAAYSDQAEPQGVDSEARSEGTIRGKGSMQGEGEEAKPARRAARGDLADDFEEPEAPAPRVITEMPKESLPRGDLRSAEAYLRDSLLRRLGSLMQEMEKEQDLDRLRKQLECIEGLVRVLKALTG